VTEWRLERLDAPQLQGLSTGEAHRRALHVHGTWGNFYENVIATDTSAPYAEHGFGFATVNTAGHDAGSITEDLNSATDEIGAWMRHFEQQGTEEWILQGHSLGALKLMRQLLDGGADSRIRGVVLLSPFDLPAFYAQSGDQGQIDSQIAAVEAFAEDQGREATVPTEIFDIWPVSAGTMIAALQSGGPLDVFQSRTGTLSHIRELQLPALVLLGGADFAATPNARDVAEQVSKAGVEVRLIEDAPHNFGGYEDQVNGAISEFLSREL